MSEAELDGAETNDENEETYPLKGEWVTEEQPAKPTEEIRLYVSTPENWEAHLKQTWEKEYCYAQRPEDDFFHLLVCGEIYLKKGTEKYCLSCAYRQGVLTQDRLHWQHKGSRK